MPQDAMGAASVVVVTLASCGRENVTDHADDAASATGSSSPSATESATASQSPSVVAQPAMSASELFATIDAAVAKETSG